MPAVRVVRRIPARNRWVGTRPPIITRSLVFWDLRRRVASLRNTYYPGH